MGRRARRRRRAPGGNSSAIPAAPSAPSSGAEQAPAAQPASAPSAPERGADPQRPPVGAVRVDRLDPRLGPGLGEAGDDPLGRLAFAARRPRGARSARVPPAAARSKSVLPGHRRDRTRLPSGDARWPLLHPLPRPRDPDRRRLVLVPDPLLLIISMSSVYGDVLGESSTATAPFAFAVLSAIGFFGSILLHELGHAFSAVRRGVGISSIQLWMLRRRRPHGPGNRQPGAEFEVAVAGPAVTLAIVVVLYRRRDRRRVRRLRPHLPRSRSNSRPKPASPASPR